MYWPNKQSIHLNLEVANLFIQTYKKLSINLCNTTNQVLPTDILDNYVKQRLLINILIELEIIVIDLVELDLNKKDIKSLFSKITYNLIYKTIKKIIYCEQIYYINPPNQFNCNYNKLFFEDNQCITENLFIYLIFGSNHIDHKIFQFDINKTPKYHVKNLFENFIIQISNAVIFNFLENNKSLKNIYKILIDKNLCNKNYKSIRNISKFQNNLYSYNWLNKYVFFPQNIYCNQCKVWLFSSKGLIYRYIYSNRYLNYIKLSNSQISALIYLEVQDYFIPKINYLIQLLGKLIIYLILDIIRTSTQIILNQIIIRLNNSNK
uniref:Ycf55 n=1 Tax=Porolithon onkodes TaxID=231751 RepID=A0A2Z2KS05_9FLOR|nr:hypothetical protein [Porolithon onkodes]ASB29638.1 hypothetical protein [Porolithon onkodes]